MPKTNAQALINARVDEFFADLQSLIQQAVQEAAANALGNVGTAAPRRRRKKTGKRKAAKATRKKRGKRVRRSVRDLAKTADAIVRYVKANPGAGMSDLTNAVGGTAVSLRGPLNELLAARKLRKEGQKRGTKYYAGAGGSRKARKVSRKAKGRKKAAKRKASKRRRSPTKAKGGKKAAYSRLTR